MKNCLFIICISYFNFSLGGVTGLPTPVQLENVNVTIPGVGQTLSAERFITCKDLSCFLSPGEPESKDLCYDWTVREINTPYLETNCNIVQGYTIEACKESALYLARVYDKKNGNLPPRYYAFIVYIIESIDLIQMTNITDCFDEDVELKFKVNLHGKGFSELQTSTKFLRFESKAKSPDSYLSNFDLDYNPSQEIKVKVPQMEKDVKMSLSKDPKSYILQNSIRFLNDNGCTSSSIEITVYRLWIELFKHTGTDMNGNAIELAPDNWMVVMNYNIECKVSPEHLIDKMTISLGNFWGPLTNGESNFPYLSNLRIDEASAPELSNLVFGDGPYSIVIATVSCKDGKTRVITSDKYEEYEETIVPGQGQWNVSKRYMSPGKKAKIFFDKDEYPKVGEQSAPNWYKYWNQFCSESKNDSEAPNTFEEYLQAPVTTNPNAIRYAELDKFNNYPVLTYNITYYNPCGCSYIKQEKKGNKLETIYSLFGVHNFFFQNVHEHAHAKIHQQRWPGGVVDLSNDKDHDAIPDDYEDLHRNDGLDPKIPNSNYDYLTKENKGNSNDIIFHHKMIDLSDKSINNELLNQINLADIYDWSYHSKLNSICQGKQWEK